MVVEAQSLPEGMVRQAAMSGGVVDASVVATSRGVAVGDLMYAVLQATGRHNWKSVVKCRHELVECSCGSMDRLATRLREAAGLVCVTCGRDEAGVEWSPDDVAESH